MYMSRSLDCEGVSLGHMLLLNTNKEPYNGSPAIALDLTEMSESMPLRFKSLYFVMEPI